MTMSRLFPGYALAAWYLYLVFSAAGSASADDTSTTISTITTRSTILTLTRTIAGAQATYGTTQLATATANPNMAIGSGHGSYSGEDFKNAVLNSTNLFRAQHQAKPLSWNDGLAAFGQQHAEKCIWEHSGGPHGENMALNFANPTLAIDAWANEQKEYNYESSKFSEATGHFTQLVWESTTTVGCGAVSCNSDSAKGWFLVCEYDPPGNVVGAFKENVRGTGGGKDGMIGLNAGTKIGGVSRMLIALVAVSSFAVTYL